MSDNETESKVPGKSIQIVLTIVFAVVALALVMIVQPFGTVHLESKSVSPAPGAAPAGAPPAIPAQPK